MTYITDALLGLAHTAVAGTSVQAHGVSGPLEDLIMRALLQAALLTLALLPAAACASAPPKAVSVYMVLGSRQCQDGGRTLAEVQKVLRDGGVQVLGSSCGNDGMAYPAMCGAPDGRIAIIDVPEGQVEAALKLGFSLLSQRPRAQRMAC